ncbi:MAG: hypothetical protein NTW26_11950 [bacterium]|nr:hypothetical protein [bacterium]
MPEITEIARLIVVRLEPDLPWCVMDPWRWAEAGATGETAILSMMSYTDETRSKFLNYVLLGCTVTISVYHDAYKVAPYPALLRFDEKVSFPVNHRKLEGLPRRLFEEHPELRVRVCPDRLMGVPVLPGLTQMTPERWKPLDRERYPLVLAQSCTIAEGEGIVLAEPVTLLHPKVDLKERDLRCQAPGLY